MTWYKSATPRIMYIMRGPSGAGKSTKAKEMGISGTVLSTDDFWMKDGKYEFNRDRLGEAHQWNQSRTIETLRKGVSPVIIDNTNIDPYEMKNYVHMAQQFGYQVKLVAVDVKNTAKELAERNKHGVPEDVIQKMIERYNPNVTVRDILKSQPPAKTEAAIKPPSDLESIRAKIIEASHGDPSLIHLSNQLRTDPAKGMLVADFRQQPNPQAVQFLYRVTDQLASQGYSFKYYNPEQNVYWIKARNSTDNWSTHKRAQSGYSQIYGEYWIGDQGQVMYADGDIGQKGHTAYVVDYILDSHNVSYQIFQDLLYCNYPLPNGSKDIYEELKKKGLKPQEITIAIDAVNGNGNAARQYGLQQLGWKRVMGNNIETHTLTQMDLSTIIQGLNEIAQENEVGFSTWNIECNSPQRYFVGIPLNIMEMGLKAVMSYRTKGSQPMNLPNGVEASGWYNKVSQVIDGREKGLNYQSFGHREKNVVLWWLDYDWNIQTQAVTEANHIHDNMNIPEGTIFVGRYIPQDKIITVYNRMRDPMVPRWFNAVKRTLLSKFGADNKIYTFFE